MKSFLQIFIFLTMQVGFGQNRIFADEFDEFQSRVELLSGIKQMQSPEELSQTFTSIFANGIETSVVTQKFLELKAKGVSSPSERRIMDFLKEGADFWRNANGIIIAAANIESKKDLMASASFRAEFNKVFEAVDKRNSIRPFTATHLAGLLSLGSVRFSPIQKQAIVKMLSYVQKMNPEDIDVKEIKNISEHPFLNRKLDKEELARANEIIAVERKNYIEQFFSVNLKIDVLRRIFPSFSTYEKANPEKARVLADLYYFGLVEKKKRLQPSDFDFNNSESYFDNLFVKAYSSEADGLRALNIFKKYHLILQESRTADTDMWSFQSVNKLESALKEVNPEFFNHLSPVSVYLTFNGDLGTGGEYWPPARILFVRPNINKGTLIHELTHAWDLSDPKREARRKEWIEVSKFRAFVYRDIPMTTPFYLTDRKNALNSYCIFSPEESLADAHSYFCVDPESFKKMQQEPKKFIENLFGKNCVK